MDADTIEKSISILEASIENAADISHLNHKILNCGLGILSTTRRLIDILDLESHRILIAKINGKVVGYIQACTYDTICDEQSVDILALAVDEIANKSEIEKKLMLAVEQWAKELEAKSVRIISQVYQYSTHAFELPDGYHMLLRVKIVNSIANSLVTFFIVYSP